MTREANEPSREERVNAIVAEWLRAADAGQAPRRDEVMARHPDLADDLRSFFADHDAAAQLAQPQVAPPSEAATLAAGAAPPAPVGRLARREAER